MTGIFHRYAVSFFSLGIRLIWRGQNIRRMPNPCIFSVNDLMIGATSVDTLLHLKKEEVVKTIGAEQTPHDAMANVCRYIIEQRRCETPSSMWCREHGLDMSSFYPLFPAPITGDVNLDVSHAKQADFGPSVPDILVLPSVLKHFHKVSHADVVTKLPLRMTLRWWRV